jgi:alkanesulfonate monooxygenase SsuD/methylene tetrahydromethanopterin reductase-like flavin-dependent oxidoreductase (luciferase family)
MPDQQIAAAASTVRIGLHSGQQYSDFGQLRQLWHRAEELGYDWLSVFDHLRPPIYGPAGPCLEAVAVLSALAGATSRVRCALLVANPAWRHPALLAMAAATVDHISGGRVELGLGAGGPDLGFNQYGLPEPSATERLERLDETCQLVRALFDGGPVTFRGQHFSVRDAYLEPRPVQDRLPIVLGGSGSRLLRLAARHADVWNCIALPLPDYARRVEELAEACRSAGRDETEVRRSITLRAVVTADAATARRRREELRSATTGVAADLTEYVSFGNAQQCLDALAPYVELGVRDFLFGARPPLDWDSIENFALSVAPVLRQLA